MLVRYYPIVPSLFPPCDALARIAKKQPRTEGQEYHRFITPRSVRAAGSWISSLSWPFPLPPPEPRLFWGRLWPALVRAADVSPRCVFPWRAYCFMLEHYMTAMRGVSVYFNERFTIIDWLSGGSFFAAAFFSSSSLPPAPSGFCVALRLCMERRVPWTRGAVLEHVRVLDLCSLVAKPVEAEVEFEAVVLRDVLEQPSYVFVVGRLLELDGTSVLEHGHELVYGGRIFGRGTYWEGPCRGSRALWTASTPGCVYTSPVWSSPAAPATGDFPARSTASRTLSPLYRLACSARFPDVCSPRRISPFLLDSCCCGKEYAFRWRKRCSVLRGRSQWRKQLMTWVPVRSRSCPASHLGAGTASSACIPLLITTVSIMCAGYHLFRNHNASLDAELALARAEELFQAGS